MKLPSDVAGTVYETLPAQKAYPNKGATAERVL